MLLLLTNTILLGPPSLKDPASNRSRRKNFCHKPEFSTHICCHMRRRSLSTLTPAAKQQGDRKILMANFPSCIIDINYYHWPWDHYYVNLRKNYLASIKKLKEVELSLLEPCWLANVRADEPNERQVVEALHKAIKARWVRWTDKVVQCVIRRCCKMCTMEWR